LGIFERGGGTAVEEVAFDFGAVFAGDGDVAAVVESFLQGLAEFFFRCQLGIPAFQLLVLGARGYFERVGIGVLRMFFDVASFFACHKIKSFTTEDTEENRIYARVSCSSCDDDEGAIWINGFTGACGSSSMCRASSSLYRVKSVPFTVARKPDSELKVAFTALAS